MKTPWGILQEVYGARMHLIPRRWVVLPRSTRFPSPLLRAKEKREAHHTREFSGPPEGLFQLPQARGYFVPASPSAPTDESVVDETEAPSKKNFPKI